MTNEEAIANLERIYSFSNEETKAAIDKAIKALGKQIPKKPQTTIYTDYTLLTCPNCDSQDIRDVVKGYRYQICPDCGQKIDWGQDVRNN